jgi:dihydropteroate synthase
MLTSNAKSSFQRKLTINIGGHLIDLMEPKIMGILNITPDSFYDGGRYDLMDPINKRISSLIDEGADFIDIGAVSSRPGAGAVSMDKEWERLEPVLRILREKHPAMLISVDTYRSEIVRRTYNLVGSFLVNDISGGDFDEDMFQTISELKIPYLMMHMQGEPATMQQNPQYDDVVVDICKIFASKLEKLYTLGVNDVLLDPGFGFGKTVEQNYELLDRLEEFKIFEIPLVVGLSRKSMIYKALDTSPEEALMGTSVLNAIALNSGARLLRVHDVKEAKQVVKLAALLKQSR